MKKIVLLLAVFLVVNTNAWADICYDVSDKVANHAADIIQKQREIYQYCSICPDAEPKSIPVNDVKNGNPVYVNGVALDLAHTYYKQDNKFVNLGVTSGCIKAGEYGIAAELDSLLTIHRSQAGDMEEAKKQSQERYERCVGVASIKENMTTSDMIEQDTKINDCLADAIRLEVEKGFNPEQQEKMLKTLSQIREEIRKFYFGIYAENKYCYGACGTISDIMPYADEGKILMQMLEQVIYLNLAKNGY